MMTAPYNKDQIKKLTNYGHVQGVERFKLHAYISDPGIKDEDGYTKAYNADVAELSVQPAHLAQGIEDLLLQHPNTDVTISSKVMVNDSVRHIPMLDMKIPYVPGVHTNHISALNNDIDRFLEKSGAILHGFGPAAMYVSGHSFHLYGLERIPMSDTQFLKFVSAVLVCDHDLISDHAWLGFALQRQEFRLRLTAVQRKYTMIPTESWKTETLQALQIQNEVKRNSEAIPF